MLKSQFITGPPNGPVLSCSLSSSVTLPAGGRPGRVGGLAADTARWASMVVPLERQSCSNYIAHVLHSLCQETLQDSTKYKNLFGIS